MDRNGQQAPANPGRPGLQVPGSSVRAHQAMSIASDRHAESNGSRARMIRNFQRIARGAFAALALGLGLGASPAQVQAQESVCAEVKIEILQKVSLERQAFDALMRISNGLEGVAVEDVSVVVRFEDEQGNSVPASSNPDDTSAMFFLRLDSADGLGGVDGSGRVGPKSSGEARWLIIPAAGAGGSLPSGRQYRVGATVSYRLGDEARTVDVAPETITVRPQPMLTLDYFLPYDVFGDDPWTPEEEPPEPFTLGVRVSNIGHGPARNLSIESAQPRIVENEQGLLVGFEILGSAVGNAPGDPSLLVAFGDLEPGASQVARWRMATTLNGRFVEFAASYTHAPELGGALTSLLDSTRAHELLAEVLVDLPGRDAIPDFLARSHRGSGDATIRVHESNGVDTVVTDVSAASSVVPEGNGGFRFDVPATSTFSYASVASPVGRVDGSIRARRADGSLVPEQNAWVSRIQNQDHSYTWYLNLFDTRFSGSYTLTRVDAPQPSALQGVVYHDADADGSRGAGEPGIAGVDVVLSGTGADGYSVAARTLRTDIEGRFSFDGLVPGTYSVAVGDVPGRVNGTHAAGSAGGQVLAASIAGIELASGQRGTDYLFAKRDRLVADGADIAVAWSGAPGEVKVAEPFQLVLGLVNNGPRAAGAVAVDVAFPEHLGIDGVSVTGGAYDPATGRWTLDAIAAGEALALTLTARTLRPGSIRFSALALEQDAGGFDPNEDNNSASIDLVVDPWVLVAGIEAWERVLVLAPCITDGLAGDDDEGPRCADAASGDGVAAVAHWLDAQGAADYRIVAGTEAHLDALASGHWNVHWLRGTADRVDDSLATHLRMAVLRGESLLIDGGLQGAGQPLVDLVGASQANPPATGAFAIVVEPDRWLPAGMHSGFGEHHRLDAAGASVVATWSGQTGAAVVDRRLGLGRIVALGTELLSPTGNLEPVFGPAVFQAVKPHATERVDAGGMLVIAADVVAGHDAQLVTTSVSWPQGGAVAHASPGDGIVDGSQVHWVGWSQEGLSARHLAAILAPDQPGTGAVDVSASREANGVQRDIGEVQIPVHVHGFAEFAALARALAEELGDALYDPEREAILGAIDAAMDHHAGARWRATRQALVDAVTRLRSHPAHGVEFMPATEALALAYKIVLREGDDEPPVCRIPGQWPGRYAGTGFVENTPIEGLAAEGTLLSRSPVLLSLGAYRSGGWFPYSMGMFTTSPGRTYRFVLEHVAGGESVLQVLDGSTQVARVSHRIRGEYNAIRFNANVDAVLAAVAGNAGLDLDVDRIDGQPVQVGMGLSVRGARTGNLTLLFPEPGNPFTLEGTLRLRHGSALSLPSFRLEMATGNVDCDAP